MIDFAEARRLVDIHLRPEWNPEDGVFYVAPWGWEDRYAYQVIILDSATGRMVDAFGTVLVTKENGNVRLRADVTAERLNNMTPVGEGRP